MPSYIAIEALGALRDTHSRDTLPNNAYVFNNIPGIITLNNLQKLSDSVFHWLNVSVSDGVYTSHAKVRIEILSTNLHSPVFKEKQYEARVSENQQAGVSVLRVQATDADPGFYGQISYSFVSHYIMEKFHINNVTGMYAGVL